MEQTLSANAVRYSEFNPSASLKPFIECYWSMENEPGEDLYMHEKILPYACTEMLFFYGTPSNWTLADSTRIRLPKSLLVGQMQSHMCIETNGSIGVFGIKFKPCGLYQLLNKPMYLFTNTMVDLVDVLGPEASAVTDQVIHASSVQKRMDAVENFLLRQLKKHRRSTPLNYVQQAVTHIMESRGCLSIANLATTYHVCDRQMERKFQERVGISPKMLARVMRINYVCKLLRMYPQLSWLDVIFSCGYYDQAHFIRDFKAMAGESPTRFFARPSFLNNAFLGR